MKQVEEKLALLGGPKSVTRTNEELFRWPIITAEDEEAVLEVLRRGGMSGTDVTEQFEREMADWLGVPFALGFHNGTASLQAAMFGCGVGVGDEIIAPALTYWATAMPAFSLGASVVFADIDPVTLGLDAADIEQRITSRTKAIVVVHYLSHPADMDPILNVAAKHGVKVIEDVSHALGGLYKGRPLGTIGDVGAMSMMTGKAFAIGEGGMLVTRDRTVYERAIAFGHYERYGSKIETPELQPYIGLPLGGIKYRMHQLSSAVGRVQLKYYEKRIAEIERAMSYFWEGLSGLPGVKPHRPESGSGSRNGGWYAARGRYEPEALGGLSVTSFCAALRAEGVLGASPGCNLPLHLHPFFHNADVYGHGKPTILANANRDLRQPEGSLPVTESISERLFALPWFKHEWRDQIDEYVLAFRKVIVHHRELLAVDTGNPPTLGGWHFFNHSSKN